MKKIKPYQAVKHPKWKMGKKITIDSATLMNKIFELVEAQKLFNLPSEKIDIILHPNSLVHAILELKNGLKKFIYHETSMKIPLANAIFNDDVDIKKFYINNNSYKFENLIFKKIDKKIFPTISLKEKINEYPSTPIIVNAANEILVDHFLQKKIAFLDINKTIIAILKDINYKKYAIKKPKNINQINLIDLWARTITLKKIEKIKMLRYIFIIFFSVLLNSNLHSEIVKKFSVEGNKRISDETIKIYGDIKLNQEYSENDLNEILRSLYETEFFEDIKVNLKNNVLTISVKEFPFINQLVITGEKSKKYRAD